MKANYFCSFHLMCQFVWMFYRDEYSFHFQYQAEGMQSPARQDMTYYNLILTDKQRLPVARTCAHYKYIDGNWREQETYRELMKFSICYSGGFKICPEQCKSYNQSLLRKELFKFEVMSWLWDSRCYDAQVRHNELLSNYENSEYQGVLRTACYEVDTLTFSYNY